VAYWVAVVARNAEQHLASTINSLLEQTLKPARIVIVDDGSTPKILSRFSSDYPETIRTIALPDKGYDIRRVPSNINKAWTALRDLDAHYFMISGDDCKYPADYARLVISMMDSDEGLAVASGRPSSGGNSTREHVPSGSGRIVRASFWSAVGGQYPQKAGWETWLLYKASQKGLKVKLLESLVYEHARPRGVSHQFKYWGAAMWTLGYHPLYAIGRILRNVIRRGLSRFGPLNMAIGYLEACMGSDDPFLVPFEPPLRKFVHHAQARAISELVSTLI
jgi:hypothetical protein